MKNSSTRKTTSKLTPKDPKHPNSIWVEREDAPDFKMLYIERSDYVGTKRNILKTIHGLSKKEGHCYASVDNLASRIGIATRTLQDHLRDLEAAGVIDIEYNVGEHRQNHYRICEDNIKVTGVGKDNGCLRSPRWLYLKDGQAERSKKAAIKTLAAFHWASCRGSHRGQECDFEARWKA